MIFLLNLIWFICGGFFAGLGWFLAGIIMACTIIGLPWVPACFRIGQHTMWPFGREIVERGAGVGTGFFGTLGNVIWFIFAGWWLALGHITLAFAWAVTIIGLPFAWAHLKLAYISLFPIGKMIVITDNVSFFGYRLTRTSQV